MSLSLLQILEFFEFPTTLLHSFPLILPFFGSLGTTVMRSIIATAFLTGCFLFGGNVVDATDDHELIALGNATAHMSIFHGSPEERAIFLAYFNHLLRDLFGLQIVPVQGHRGLLGGGLLTDGLLIGRERLGSLLPTPAPTGWRDLPSSDCNQRRALPLHEVHVGDNTIGYQNMKRLRRAPYL